MRNIYLVGFMGTGKTTVGKKLAALQKHTFIDLDDLIESKEKRKISDIFAARGEPYFRAIEKKALQEVSQKEDLVVGCGGGIVIDKENIALMKATGKIICLSATPEIILKRTSGRTHRPLLNVADPKAKIASLLENRASCYALADETIDTSHLSPDEVVKKIISLFS
jgi:shikimate kinase